MRREAAVRAYVEALQAGNLGRMLALFAPGATVTSPLAGTLPATAFYKNLFDDSERSALEVLGVLEAGDAASAAVELRYDWTLRGGARSTFDCVDLFTFADDGRIAGLRIYYDPAAVRPLYDAVRRGNDV